MTFIVPRLSHAILGGSGARALLGVNVVLGAGAWGVASALMINGVTRRRVIGADAAIGVITTASFALGLALFALFGRRGQNFDAALFGSILGVEPAQVWAIGVLFAVLSALVFLYYRPLLFTTFDPEVAAASGVATGWIEVAMMVALAATILAGIQVLGVTLIAAVLVIPPTVARMLTHSFVTMLTLSTLIGSVTGFIGMNLSYHLDIQSGPAIVLVGAALFAVVFATSGPSKRSKLAAVPNR